MSTRDELTEAVSAVCNTLTQRGVPYFITGSVASSTHAECRATNDIDIGADFRSVDIRALISAFD